jgi:hypothetical protein
MADYRRYGSMTDAKIYHGDNSLVGIVKEFKISDIEWKTVDIETLGQVAVYKAPTRSLEALTGSLKLQALEPELVSGFYNPTIVHPLQIHHTVDLNSEVGFDRSKSFTLITLLQSRFFKSGFGGISLGDEEDLEFEFSVQRLVQRVHDSDTTLLEVDVFANKAGNSSGDFWS